MRKIFLLSLFAVLSLGLMPVNASHAAGANKVIYHVNLGNEQATDALRNISNHLAVDPAAKIVVVTHSTGVDFLLEGAEDRPEKSDSGGEARSIRCRRGNKTSTGRVCLSETVKWDPV